MGADQLEDDTAQLAGSDVVRIWGKFGNIFCKLLSFSVPRTAIKCLISIATFAIGVVNILWSDSLLRRKSIRTSLLNKIREVTITVSYALVMLTAPALWFKRGMGSKF